jgi:hypothetical protein
LSRDSRRSDEDRDDEGQGDREQHEGGHQVEDQLQVVRVGDPLVDLEIDEAQDAAHDKDEGEDKEGHEEGVKDLPEDVSVEDAEHARAPSHRVRYQFVV